MKVVHITSGPLNSGAGKGVLNLHRALNNLGVHSRILHSGDPEDIPGCDSLNSGLLSRLWYRRVRKASKRPLKNYPNRKRNHLFTVQASGLSILNFPAYKEADIVHLHWIGEATFQLQDLKAIEKPVVWTVRDMWPFTGGCHYALSCRGYLKNCGQCSILNSGLKEDLSSFLLAEKRKIFRHIHFVGISSWLTEQAELGLRGNFASLSHIPNAVNVATFSPADKKKAKLELGLDVKIPVVAFGAQDLMVPYKGGQHFQKAIALLQEPVQILLFGRANPNYINEFSQTVYNMGFVDDDCRLQTMYRAADVFVAPSLQEAFGKTLVEAMLCGTPVVAFNYGGPADIVKHKKTGYLAQPFEASSLAEGIQSVLAQPDKESLRIACRERAKRYFDSKIIAQTYINKYAHILNPVKFNVLGNKCSE